MSELPFFAVEQGVRLNVRLTPNAKKNGIGSCQLDIDDKLLLKVSVTAIPEKGKANDALIKLLAKEWRLAKSDIEITHGHTDRRKTLLLRGESTTLMQQLTEWMKQNNV